MVQEDLIVPKTWFEQWRSPHEFYRKVDDCMSQFEPDVILGMTEAQHLFDAHVAGLFARVWNDHHPCKVKLEAGVFPDAHLRDAKDTDKPCAAPVPYETAPSKPRLTPADVATQAREFTVLVECWK